jgi:heme exporter protein A
MSSSSAISARDVRVSFGMQPVLRGVDFEVAVGERVGLIGRNGAGKTTLLRTLAGLIRPAGGEIRILGESTRSTGLQWRRQLGVVGHQTMLHPQLTVQENLQFYARLYGVPDPAARVTAVLRDVDLYGRRNQPVGSLSRGTSQRLALARAIIHDPPILLLDEPDAGLDAPAFAILERLLRSPRSPIIVGPLDPHAVPGPKPSPTWDSARTVILTTHDFEHALRLCDQVVVLEDGRLVERTPASRLTPLVLRERVAAVATPPTDLSTPGTHVGAR